MDPPVDITRHNGAAKRLLNTAEDCLISPNLLTRRGSTANCH